MPAADHKFEPITQEYYQLQSIFSPRSTPRTGSSPRSVRLRLSAGRERRVAPRTKRIDAEVAALRGEFRRWVRRNVPGARPVWSRLDPPNAPYPGDGAARPRGRSGRRSDASRFRDHARRVNKGTLRVAASQGVQAWVSTEQAFDWTPERRGTGSR
ncbi:MAG: hypothetical protein WKF75_13115 [Singulisphaera sp.]